MLVHGVQGGAQGQIVWEERGSLQSEFWGNKFQLVFQPKASVIKEGHGTRRKGRIEEVNKEYRSKVIKGDLDRNKG